MTTEDSLAYIHQQDVEQVLSGIHIPSPPALILELHAQLNSDSPQFEKVVELISTDAGISAGVIRMLNSPYYALSERDLSIQHAALALGMNTLMNIVRTLCLRAAMSQASLSPQQQTYQEKIWDSSALVAMMASTVSTLTGCCIPGRAYLLGLFCNAGMALMLAQHENYVRVMHEAYIGNEPRLVDTELRYFDTNHALIGYYIAQSWHLPKLLCEAVAIHHDGRRHFAKASTEFSPYKDMLAVLKMAEHLSGSYQSLSNQTEDFEWMGIKENVLHYLGLSEEQYQQIACQVSAKTIRI